MNTIKRIFVLLVFSLSLFLGISCKPEETLPETKQYEVAFDEDNGNEIKKVTVLAGNLVEEYKPLKEGYTFLCWQVKGTKDTFDFKKGITKNVVLQAEYLQNSYVVTFVENDTTTITQTVDWKKLCKSYTPKKEGYLFLYWEDEETLEPFDFSTLIVKNKTLIAIYEKEVIEPMKTYTVTYKNADDEILKTETVKEGDMISSYQPSRDGYDFLYWTKNFVRYDAYLPVTSDLELVCKWEMNLETLKQKIQETIPSVVTSKVDFIHYFKDSSAILTWESLNKTSLTDEGYIYRDVVDQVVKLVVTIEKDGQTETMELSTTVKKVELKPLTKPLIVGYSLGTSFASYTQDTVKNLNYIIVAFAQIVSGKISTSQTSGLREMLGVRNYGVRCGLSICDFTSTGFRSVIETSETRKTFVDSILELAKEKKIDGIDLDWEYPSYSDRPKYNLLLEELSLRLKAYRPDFIISMATTQSLSNYDYASLSKYVDYFNVMTYDYATGSTAYHNSNLYRSGSSYSCDTGIQSVLTVCPSEKVLIGAAFYARYAKFNSTVAFGARLATSLKTTCGYKDIQELLKQGAIEYLDEVACANYCIYENAFYTYDSPYSLKKKGEYAKNNSLAGVMIWQLGDEPSGYLIDCIAEGLKK
jgi:chitinase